MNLLVVLKMITLNSSYGLSKIAIKIRGYIKAKIGQFGSVKSS